jgi:hypothetical protein
MSDVGLSPENARILYRGGPASACYLSGHVQTSLSSASNCLMIVRFSVQEARNQQSSFSRTTRVCVDCLHLVHTWKLLSVQHERRSHRILATCM